MTIDNTQIKYYRNLARFLYLSKLETEQLTDLANDVLNEDISELKISRPHKISHKAVPSVMIKTPPGWVAGVDFPLSFSGSRKSPIKESAINILTKERMELSEWLLKNGQNLDFDKLHNKLKIEDISPKHIVTFDDYATITYNGKQFKQSEKQRVYLKEIHKRFIDSNNKIFEADAIFKYLEEEKNVDIYPHYIHQLFRKPQGLWNNLILPASKGFYSLDLDF